MDLNGANGYAQLRLRATYTPTSSSDANGNQGQIAWDNNYIYVKTSLGWKFADLNFVGTVKKAFATGVTGTTIDLDANTGVVTNSGGSNVAFLPPSNLDDLMVIKNGLVLKEITDYSINTSTNVITFVVTLTPSDVITFQR